MNLLTNPVLKVVGLLALASIFFAGCSEDPTDPNRNATPETSITTYGIATAPDTAAIFLVTVYWRASDPDGRPEFYRYWVTTTDSVRINLTPRETVEHFSLETFETSAIVQLNFANLDSVYIFYVQARDSQNEWDPTPAQTRIAKDDVTRLAPETEAVTVPPNGFEVARGIRVVVSGDDFDGFVPTFQWAVDDTSDWQSADVPDSLISPTGSVLTAIIDSTYLTLGTHTVYFRAVDNRGYVDLSPLTFSVAVVNTLLPDLWVASGAIANAFYFLPQGGTTVDLSTTWVGDANWYYSPVQFRYAVDDTAAWTAWIDASGATLTGLTAGSHAFYLEARDLAGNTIRFVTNFGIGQLVADRGVLIINGLSWGDYTPQPENMYTGVLPFGSLGFDFWDLLDGEGFYPAVVESELIGSNGAVPGDTLGHYSSAVFFMNAFGGDDAVYATMVPLISSYLDAGGNVLIAGRFGAIFLTPELLAYGVTDPMSFARIGVNPPSLEPAVEGLVSMTRFGSSSLTDLLATPTDPNVTTLFTVPGFTDAVGGVIVEPDNGGKFAFVGGRMYRFDPGPVNTNFTYILTNYFGEQ